MALAIHFDGLIRKGVVRDYADLARLGGVTRARVTQIMNLLNLPPWRQEEILFLPGAESGREAVTERDLRAVVAQINWQMQRSLL
jgi:alkylated DNA nucleotide flippase Atl1